MSINLNAPNESNESNKSNTSKATIEVNVNSKRKTKNEHTRRMNTEYTTAPDGYKTRSVRCTTLFIMSNIIIAANSTTHTSHGRQRRRVKANNNNIER